MNGYLLGTTILAILLAFYWLLLVVKVVRKPQLLPQLPSVYKDTERRPSVSIVVAVRNESGRILRESIMSMLLQDYPDFEVVAVDDHSTDNSQAILKEMLLNSERLRVIDAEAVRHGKRAALAQGAMEAKGEWLLFTDADVIHSPEALLEGMTFLKKERVDALSLLPKTLAISFWEQVALAASAWLAYCGVSIEKCNNDNAPVGLAAAGPFILVRQYCYDAIGGHDAVPQNALLDCAFAARIRQAGFKYRYADSGGLVEARMYRSLSEMVEGFGKNAFLALGGRLSAAIAASAGFLGVTLLPPLMLIVSFWALRTVGSQAIPGAIASAFAVAAMFLGQFQAAQFMGTKPRLLYLFLSPVGALIWSGIVTHSILQFYLRDGVLWKGRRIPVFPEKVQKS